MGLIPKKKLKIKRFGEGTRDTQTNEYIDGPDYVGYINGSVQVLTPNEMQALPEGRRETQSYKVIDKSSDPLVLNTVLQEGTPDNIEIYDEWYELVSRGKWENNLINHYNYIAQRITVK